MKVIRGNIDPVRLLQHQGQRPQAAPDQIETLRYEGDLAFDVPMVSADKAVMKMMRLWRPVETVQVKAAALRSAVRDHGAAIDAQRNREAIVVQASTTVVRDICRQSAIGHAQSAKVVNAPTLAHVPDR